MGTVSSTCNTPTTTNPSIPLSHKNCRFDMTDGFCDKNEIYTRTTDIKRFPVLKAKIKWKIDYPEYRPTDFTSAKIKTRDGALYKDPDVTEKEYKEIEFNKIDSKYNCNRKSHHGIYEMLKSGNNTLVPRNPVGRTGIIGRGHLGRWGPNHAADSIVTCWKRDNQGKKVYHDKSKKPILQFVAIRRRDTKQWAIPGGMIDAGEQVSKTLLREFSEEALSENFKFSETNKVVNAGKLGTDFNTFFNGGIQIYRGYVDDPRNTDNAWMETLACNFHDESSEIVNKFKLKGGSDADSAQWLDMSSDLSLFASHADFLKKVAEMHHAHW